MTTKILLKLRIECARTRLHELAKKHSAEFGHPAVIKQSILLDELINQYNRLVGEQLKKPIV